MCQQVPERKKAVFGRQAQQTKAHKVACWIFGKMFTGYFFVATNSTLDPGTVGYTTHS